MDLTDGLEEYVAIVDEGSVSAAARSMRVPRATLSRRLSRLEHRLGVRLLHRGARRMVPTRAGEELYRRARRIVEEARAANEAVRRLDDTPRGLLRVSVPPGVGAPLSDVFTSFLDAYPEVELEVRATTRHVDMIAEGIDVALRAGKVRDLNLVGRPLWRTRVVAVASPAYLDRRGRPVVPADLSSHDCLSGFEAGARPQRTWPLTDGGTVKVRGRLVSNSLELIANAALANQGIALVPAALVQSDLQSGRLQLVLADTIGFGSSLTLVYPERDLLDPKVRAFVDHAVERLSDLDITRLMPGRG